MPSSAEPKILYCCNAYPPKFIGGAELIVEKHARALRAMGYEAAVFAGEGQETFGQHYAIRKDDWNQVPVWRIQLGCEDYVNTTVNFINRPVEQRFEEILDEFRPTVVHCHNLIGLSVQLLHLAKRRGLRTGLTLHDHWMYCPHNTLVAPNGNVCDPRINCECHTAFSYKGRCDLPAQFRAGMMRHIAGNVDFFHFPSDYLRGIHMLWGALPGEKCWAIPNGIELERFAGVQRRRDPDRVRLTFIGYLGEHKGIQLLVEALAGTPENSKLFLNIVGDGGLRKPLAERVKELGIADRVRFWNKVPNERICEVYEQTDCLVLPSLWPENHPVSINEAIACGIPVIASNSGGIPELVSHCKTGYLFEQGNRAALEQVLSHVARNPDCLDVLSENTRQASGRLSLGRTMRRMLELYQADEPTPGDCPVHRPMTVACIGSRSDAVVDSVAKQIEASPMKSDVHLLWADWLYDSQLPDVDLFWCLDGTLPLPKGVASRDDAFWLVPQNYRQVNTLADGRAFVCRGESDALAVIETLVGRL